jgi:hypothetical protein
MKPTLPPPLKTRASLYRLVATLAFLGFTASLICHILGWLRINIPGGETIFILHIAIFAFWVPLVILATKTMPPDSKKGNFEHLLAELPRWARHAFTAIFIYMFFNFAFFLFAAPKFPRNALPQYVLLRGFSGHWMMFYSAATLGFIGLARLAETKR